MNKKKYPAPATIVIRLNGDETVLAYLPDNPGQITRHTFAKRNPKDEYDAYIGARVALDRLFGKEDMFADKKQKEHKKEEPKFQVGDIVRVTDATFPFGRYKNGDVAVVTIVSPGKYPFFRTTYGIKVRSKERKGSEGAAFAEELTLLHRPAKEGEKK